MSDLHVLMLPSFYHTPQKPYDGTFFRDWALAMATASAGQSFDQHIHGRHVLRI